jgi:hypothetical protein
MISGRKEPAKGPNLIVDDDDFREEGTGQGA